MKQCSKCKRSDVEFGKNRSRKDGLSSWCKLCRKEEKHIWKLKNPDLYAMAKKKWRKGCINKNKIFVHQYLQTHPCVDCNESDPIVLEFDHVKSIKVENVSRLACQARSMSKIRKEIAKCEVRCANCHRRITYRRKMALT